MSPTVANNPTAVCVVPWYPFPLFNGGALRAFHVVSQVGRAYPTTAIFPASADVSAKPLESELQRRGSNVKVIHAVAALRRSMLQRLKDRISTIQSSRSLSQKSNTVSLSLLKEVDLVMRQAKPSIVLLSELDSLLLVPRIRRLHPRTPIILDMHNVNHVLLGQYIKESGGSRKAQQHYESVLKTESSLSNLVDFVFACSNHDLDIFTSLNGPRFRGAVIPNGVDTAAAEYDTNCEKHNLKNLIYCASLTTKANIDGMIWFAETIWPIIKRSSPDLSLTVVGGGSDNPRIRSLPHDPSIMFVGRVDELSEYYKNASISICPLRIGSGTRLKVLEAMSFGTPVVSTTLGCEGINVVDGENLIIRDSADDFANGITDLLASPANFHRIRNNARRFAEEKFDWNVIGHRMLEAFESL